MNVRNLWILLGLLLFGMAARTAAAEDVLYARCNLKVIGDSKITWVNWQAAPSFIPAGTKLEVTRNGDSATLVDPKTGKTYQLDIGADGETFLAKFVTRKPVDIARFPANVQSNIRKAIAKVGMTKEQVYIAMGPPTNIGRSRTNRMTYDEIVSSDLWVYARRRFGKNIGVSFDPGSGLVNRTEGIWGK